MIKLFQIFLHCLFCRRFLECKIKFYPSKNTVFQDYSFENNEMHLLNPVDCSNPMESFDD
jgi:hypothetical protein